MASQLSILDQHELTAAGLLQTKVEAMCQSNLTDPDSASKPDPATFKIFMHGLGNNPFANQGRGVPDSLAV